MFLIWPLRSFIYIADLANFIFENTTKATLDLDLKGFWISDRKLTISQSYWASLSIEFSVDIFRRGTRADTCSLLRSQIRECFLLQVSFHALRLVWSIS